MVWRWQAVEVDSFHWLDYLASNVAGATPEKIFRSGQMGAAKESWGGTPKTKSHEEFQEFFHALVIYRLLCREQELGSRPLIYLRALCT